MLLFFIYDVQKSTSESDDPLESILYFHPNSDTTNIERRISVVGQIIGTALCVKQLLSKPNLITLEKGKFALSWSGRFILVSYQKTFLDEYFNNLNLILFQVVGSTQSVPTHIIHNQRDFVHRLISSKFGELSTYFIQLEESYEEFRSIVGQYCDSQLSVILQKWTELASQPSL